VSEQIAPVAERRPSRAVYPAEGGAKASHVRLNPIGVYAVVVSLWLAFGAALLVSSGSLADLWERYRDWPLVIQGVVALLLLPWVVATWIWQTDWPLALRLILAAGLAWVTLYAFFPRTR
jgi:hypothetical protein